MASLFRNRRRGKEPPPTGNFNASRRRRPVDPPPSMQISQAADPVTRSSGGRLEMIGKTSRVEIQNSKPEPKVDAQRVATRPAEKKRLDEKDDAATVQFDENENKPVANILQAQTQQTRKKNAMAPNTGATSLQGTSSSRVDRPFTTRSNKDPMTKSLALASRLNKGSTSRAALARSSVFRKKTTSDSDTVASVSSTKSSATAKSAATSSSRNTRKVTANASTAISDHDKAALRKLLGTGPSERKATLPTRSKSTKLAKPAPVPTSKPSHPTKNTGETFDQKEYLRGLISSKAAAQKTTTAIPNRGSVGTSSNKVNPTKPALPSVQEANETTESGNEKASKHASDNPSLNGISSRSNTSASSSTSAEQKAMLRKVLAKTMTRKSGEEKARRKLSPKNKPSHLESAAVSLSRKVLSEQSKPLTPKKNHKSLTLKGYVRSKMWSSKKAHLSARPKEVDARHPYDSSLAKSSSLDSGDSSAGAPPSISQVASLSSDASDDEKTRSTLASSSQESETTKQSYESSLKGLSTAETIDTDESSTIMGVLHSASSDSMQYSSEEGCDDNTVINTSAFKAIDNVSKVPSARYVPQSVDVRDSQRSVTVVAGDQSRPQMEVQLALTCKKHDENSGYTKFLNALKSEASGAHSELWSSFQAVMTGSPRCNSPIRNAVQFRFDPATRQMLAVMNSHLKRQAMVECVTATQLVNDKKFEKEVELGLTPRPTVAIEVGAKPGGATFEQRKRVLASGPIESLQEMQRHPDGEVRRKTLGDDATRKQSSLPSMEAVSTDTTQSHGKKEKAQPKSETQRDNRLSQAVLQNSTSKALAQGMGQPQESALEKETKDNTLRSFVPATNVPEGNDAITGKLSKCKSSVGTSPQSDAPVPWSGVRLRAVSSVNTPSAATVEEEGLPWAKVKLRRVSLDEKESSEREESEQHQMQANDCLETELSDDDLEPAVRPQEEPSNESITRANQDSQISHDQSNVSGEANKLVSTGIHLHRKPCPEKPAANVVENGGEKTTTSKQSSESGETLELAKLEESACVFPIKRIGVDSDSDSAQSKVVIDKGKVMMLQSSGESEETVAWTLPRDRIKSLKLDMESQSVSLSLVDGNESTILPFMNSPHCLQFANAFYEMRKLNQEQDGTQQPSGGDQKNHHVEALNPEEQQVLESYRQARRTKPPRDAMRAVVPIPRPTLNSNEAVATNKTDQKNEVSESPPGPTSASGNKESGPAQDLNKDTIKLPLSDDDRKVAESYKKMLKLRIPPDAVKHKMLKDSVDPKIVGFVLGETGILAADTKCPGDFSDGERKAVMLYRSMLKLMVPPDDVRSRMKEDNIDEKILLAVLGQDKVEEKTLDAAKLNEAEEKIAASYRKMLKMMIPKDAVRHRMIKDQVDPKIVTAVVGVDKSCETNEKLTAEEEIVAATYRKMLKLRMPPEAVRHRMSKEGVSANIVKAILGTDAASKAGAKNGAKPGTRGSKLVSLHWTPLSGTELDNSVWGAANKGKVTAVAKAEGSDISKLVQLFQKKSTAKTVKGKAESGDGDKGSGKAKLLDLNRANIVAISLKAFKDFSYDELAEILQNLDPSRKLKGERVQFVRDLLPTAAEINTIKRYYGSPDRLVPAELWFQKIVHIKRLEEKAHVLHTMEVFENEVAEIQKSLHQLTQVCSQVMESEKLRELLDMVLQIGNIMNEGTRTGGAAGFKFDSLLRLTQTKSGDGKITVLDYMVTIYVAKGQRQTLDLIDDFPDCQAASRMLISDLVTNVKDMDEKLQKCRKEYDSLLFQSASQNKASNSTKSSGKPNSEGGGHPRLQMPPAISVRGGAADARCSPLDARKARKPAQSNDMVSSKAPQPLEQKQSSANKTQLVNSGLLQAGIVRLNNFLLKADQLYNALKTDRDLAVSTCREMSRYCGESGGERSTDGLLGILSKFASNLEAAVTKHDRMIQAEAKKQSRQKLTPKKERRRPEDLHVESSPAKRKPSPLKSKSKLKKNGKDSKTPPKQRQSPGKGTSLVLMVNELLKDANEQTKKDFTQGVVYDNPDDKLKAIYDREKNTKRAKAPPLPSGRRSVDGDLLTTIKKRQAEADGVAAKAKRTQLERVIDCINCATGAEDCTDSLSPSSSTSDTFSDHSDHSAESDASRSLKTDNHRDVDLQSKDKSEASASKTADSSESPKVPSEIANELSKFEKPEKLVDEPTPVMVSNTPSKLKEHPAQSASNITPELQADRFKDLQSRWKQCKDDSQRRLSGSSPLRPLDDEGSVDRPIDLVPKKDDGTPLL